MYNNISDEKIFRSSLPSKSIDPVAGAAVVCLKEPDSVQKRRVPSFRFSLRYTHWKFTSTMASCLNAELAENRFML